MSLRRRRAPERLPGFEEFSAFLVSEKLRRSKAIRSCVKVDRVHSYPEPRAEYFSREKTDTPPPRVLAEYIETPCLDAAFL